MTKTCHFLVCGIRVYSEVDLPDWRVFAVEPTDVFDVRIYIDDKGTRPPANGTTRSSFAPNGDLHLVIPGIVRIEVKAAREIMVTPENDSRWPEIRRYIMGSAWSAVCHQRGRLVLHASAVRVGEEAVLFCGSAGDGKSTLAAHLGKAGYEILCDDASCCDHLASPALLYPSPGKLGLWEDAIAELGWRDKPLTPDIFRASKYRVSLNRADRCGPLRVRAVYFLGWGKIAIGKLNGMNALKQLLVAAPYRQFWAGPGDEPVEYARRCATFLTKTTAWHLTRPRDIEGMIITLRFLHDHWAESRL